MDVAQGIALELRFAPEAFAENLKYMGIGMLVIFSVIGTVILCTKVANYLLSE